MANISRVAFIDTSDPEEIGYWCNVLNVDRSELLFTIARVGTSPAAVADAVRREKKQEPEETGLPDLISTRKV
ncbi:MAG TPA: DUF3606 domain-containing protein [Xanthobacteraceae bacterium]|nr:DUF3606 domain-containing protein [Xanthobacteraceae bacterium]